MIRKASKWFNGASYIIVKTVIIIIGDPNNMIPASRSVWPLVFIISSPNDVILQNLLKVRENNTRTDQKNKSSKTGESKYNHLVTSFGLKALGPVYDLMNQLISTGALSGQKFSVDPRPLDKNVPTNFLQDFIFNNFMYSKQEFYEDQLTKLGLVEKDAFTCTCYMDEVGNKPQTLRWFDRVGIRIP